MRIARRPAAFAAMVAALALCSAAAAQRISFDERETAQEGIFQGHGVVKAVEPGTGAVTIACDEIKDFMPAMETKYQVQEPNFSKSLRPGDTVDFSIDVDERVVIVGVNLLYYDQ
jgi:Cu/Ag efflux protein CusF